MAAFRSPMLATLGGPPTGDGWAYEFKWDGQRAIVEIGSVATRLFSRNGNIITANYPELVAGIPPALGSHTAVLDGEIVTLDRAGRPSFRLLQRRMHLLKPTAKLVRDTPAILYVFDVIEIDGRDTTQLPYLERRALLEDLNLASDVVQTPPFWVNVDGQTMLDTAKKHKIEGIVAKRETSTYHSGRRSPAWLKRPVRNTAEVVVAGWIYGSGGAAGGVGSLLLGAYDDDGNLVYIGHVGTGFTARDRRQLLEQLQATEQAKAPFAVPPSPASAQGARYVTPTLVGEIEYREFTGRLRHPSWKGIRPDKSLHDARWDLLQ